MLSLLFRRSACDGIMAAVEITSVVPGNQAPDQDDSWLYGDTASKDPTQSTLSANATEFVSQVQNGKADHSASESESDDDDDVQITIGEINKNAPATFGMPSSFGPPQVTPTQTIKTVGVIPAAPPIITQVSAPTFVTSKRTIDVNAVGNINGVPIYDYDIDTMCEEKPWRIPGADMTDYFNYGFNEESWKAYCDKQRGVRSIAGDRSREFTRPAPAPAPTLPTLPELPKMPGQHGGTIGVLGAKKEPHHMSHSHGMSTIQSLSHQAPRMSMQLPPSLTNLLFPPALPQPAFLPMPAQLAPPGLAPPVEIRPMIKQEDGSAPMALPPSSGPLPMPSGMFPPPGMPSMLPPPGSGMVPPMMLPPPAFSDESNSSEDERRKRRGRSHSRERKRSRERRTRPESHRERSSDHRSRSRRSPTRKEKKSSRKSTRETRGDESRHRHRDEPERSKRSRRKKEEANGDDNGLDTEQ